MFALPLTDFAVFSTGATTHVDVLFVDDHPDELQGLLAALAKGQPEWVIRVAASGREALALLQQRAADVVVSDYRMPGMDGGSLLDRVRQQYPSAVRLILSAEDGARGFMRATAAAHQVLGKPCDVEVLRRVIEETAALQKPGLQSPALVDVVHGSVAQSSTGQCSWMSACATTTPRCRKWRAGVSDPAIVTRVLQIANSSYFRRGSDVLDVQTAISRLWIRADPQSCFDHELCALLPAGSCFACGSPA
ncbi:MAG: response regulator [Lysobacteraceae bacterium]